ncbi:MAG: hypothetical protein KAG98_00935 [Lentisphaeria bacterium]|nr:hypothetical protein [Lentisphaeria bacterium]
MDTNKRNELILGRIAEGTSLSDIQKELQSKLGLSLTYMELRMLVADLEDVQWKSDEKAPVTEEDKVEAEVESVDSVLVTISKIVRPGCSLTGSVIFPSGISGEWYVDQRGGLGLDTKDDAKPSQEELVAFQQELQRMVSAQG